MLSVKSIMFPRVFLSFFILWLGTVSIAQGFVVLRIPTLDAASRRADPGVGLSRLSMCLDPPTRGSGPMKDDPAAAVTSANRRAIMLGLLANPSMMAFSSYASASDGPVSLASESTGASPRVQTQATADAMDAAPQPVGDVRALTPEDAGAMMELTTLQGWDNTLEDLQLLLGMQGSRAFGIFSSSNQLVSMCAVTHFPAAKGASAGSAWLSYVITRKDFRRRGLARKTCVAALEWLDTTYPSCSIGLYGEPTKAAPLYQELGFVDVGKTRFWSGRYKTDAILAADSSSLPSGGGKRAVNSKVRAITIGQSTALTLGRGSALLPTVLTSDERLFGACRSQALRTWHTQAPFLCWTVPRSV